MTISTIMKIQKVLFCFGIFLLSHGSSWAQETIEVDGLIRNYYLYMPENLPENAPLVFVLHGYGGSASDIRNSVGMDQIASEQGFAVCYPQGTTDPWDYTSWNAGYSNQTVDDVNFLSTLAKNLQGEHGLSVESTFCTGISNGGDMSYLLACHSPDIFQAVAPVAGCLMNWIYDSCQNSQPVSIFEIHGTDDPITLWDGDPDYPSSGRPGYMSTPDMIVFWVEKNQCSLTLNDTLPDPDGGDFVISQKHTGGIEGTEVWLYTIVGGGHDWPGVWGTMDIYASEEIWNFFNQFTSEYTSVMDPAERKKEILIFPNPVNNNLTIMDNGLRIDKLRIFNTLGTEMTFTSINEADTKYISMQNFTPGFYILQVTDRNNRVVKNYTIIKE